MISKEVREDIKLASAILDDIRFSENYTNHPDDLDHKYKLILEIAKMVQKERQFEELRNASN